MLGATSVGVHIAEQLSHSEPEMSHQESQIRSFSIKQVREIAKSKWPTAILNLDPTAYEIGLTAERLLQNAHKDKKIRPGKLKAVRAFSDEIIKRAITADAKNNGAKAAFDVVIALFEMTKKPKCAALVRTLRDATQTYRMERTFLARHVLRFSHQLKLATKRKSQGRPKGSLIFFEQDMEIHCDVMTMQLDQIMNNSSCVSTIEDCIDTVLRSRHEADLLASLGDNSVPQQIRTHKKRLQENFDTFLELLDDVDDKSTEVD